MSTHLIQKQYDLMLLLINKQFPSQSHDQIATILQIHKMAMKRFFNPKSVADLQINDQKILQIHKYIILISTIHFFIRHDYLRVRERMIPYYAPNKTIVQSPSFQVEQLLREEPRFNDYTVHNGNWYGALSMWK